MPSAGFEKRVRSLRREAELFDHFEREIQRCDSRADLARVLTDVTRELGFRHFALLHHVSLTPDEDQLLKIHNYPAEWEVEILQRGLALEDPIHQACRRTNAGFAWDEISQLLSLTSGHRRMLERGVYFGIRDGFTVPAIVPGEPIGSFTFASRRNGAVRKRQLLWAELIGVHAFREARRIEGYPAGGKSPHLSRRELQCVKLVAAGKSDWEIATILGLSEETVHQYVKRARSAYDVVSRAQLVVHALRDARISYDDGVLSRSRAIQRRSELQRCKRPSALRKTGVQPPP